MLPGQIIQAPDGLKGFDCNQHLSQQVASVFRGYGYRFAIRYVPRHKANPGDLSRSEAAGILNAGLALMIVQHVLGPKADGSGWLPSGALGKEYGAFAAQSAIDVGYLPGGMVWCDLEGVLAPGNQVEETIAFCNNWLDQVGHAGFTPGLYVGFDCELNADQLYRRLRFEHYWSAYNLNADRYPAVRGVQMKQGVEKVLSGIRFDPDTIKADALGGLPLMHVDAEWSV